eukprot:gnl/TRDRNA2_/TRDRNA2_76945_c0_seq1.p3 gnl/TRDRNA2_/TRDRNA2_76945_c0~~gnl/TRDRNA2_/TRDRNA2_76945_c0_seq1.p3  ORF type:complete len:150 (-),score=25.92 gnl/TRDRNA2_/TRDRNA2_76945_c0_seq1:75-524(-)
MSCELEHWDIERPADPRELDRISGDGGFDFGAAAAQGTGRWGGGGRCDIGGESTPHEPRDIRTAGSGRPCEDGEWLRADSGGCEYCREAVPALATSLEWLTAEHDADSEGGAGAASTAKTPGAGAAPSCGRTGGVCTTSVAAWQRGVTG